MQLNIYLISHPIIKILSNSIIQNNVNIHNKNEQRYLGLFLIYEIMRRYIDVKNIYIKQIFHSKIVYRLNSNKKHYIITNLSNTYSIIGKITFVIPNFHIIDIDYFNWNNHVLNKLNVILNDKKRQKRFIIFENILVQNNIIQLIENLNNKIKVNIKEINIACLACNQQILNKISQKYPKLNIYTTKIIL